MKSRKPSLKKALLVVDVQNDFCPGGALGVREGDKIIPNINRYIRIFAQDKLPIFVSRDWHPKQTQHFKKFGGTWPKHCIQNTKGARFHPKLKVPKEAIIVSKGVDPKQDGYSVFESIDNSGTPFINLLQILGIKELYIAGLATDYCVRYTTIYALKKGFKVSVLTDAIKGVDIKSGDSQAALKEMGDAGAKMTTLKKL